MALVLETLAHSVTLEAMHRLDVIPVVTPDELHSLYPLSQEALPLVERHRSEVIDILSGKDKRLLAIVGPCSMDGTILPDGQYAAIRMAEQVFALSLRPEIARYIKVVLREPPAKPRSDLGPAGLEQADVSLSRAIMTTIANNGVPVAMEILDRDHLARYGDLLTLGWLGARDVSRTKLRQTLSAYPWLPILCKNGTDGDIDTAVQAAKTINNGHLNVDITMGNGGLGHMRQSGGNPHTGLLYRGGKYDLTPQGFRDGLLATAKTGLPYAVDVDHAAAQSHDEGKAKSVKGILACFDNFLDTVASGSLPQMPKGIMIEAYLLEGADSSGNTPGMSLTDPCVSIGQLETMLLTLANAHRKVSPL